MKYLKSFHWSTLAVLLCGLSSSLTPSLAKDRLFFNSDRAGAKHVVLVSGDEEYRTEESMPMLAKILNRKHGFKCTVLFALAEDGSGYIDPNNQQGIVGWEALDSADLMIIGTRFRSPSEEDATHITDYLNAGKPIIGIRTSTHAFRGKGSFGGIGYGDFGIKVLGERWVSHHGGHKRQGARSVAEDGKEEHPILSGVGDIFCPSDVYEVSHLTDVDEILLRAAVTESLDPSSPNLAGDSDPKSKNSPMQPFAWLHAYESPDQKTTGKSFCTTGGASVDFVDEDLRRLIVNAALYLTEQEVPAKADVAYVDPFYPSFYGFVNKERDGEYFKKLDLRPEDFGYGKSTSSPDLAGSPEWKFRPTKRAISTAGGSDK